MKEKEILEAYLRQTIRRYDAALLLAREMGGGKAAHKAADQKIHFLTLVRRLGVSECKRLLEIAEGAGLR